MTNNLENVKTIIDFIGEDNVDKIKQEMTEALIDNMNESIEKNWVVLPDTFSVMWDALAEEVFNKYRPKIKKAMGESIEAMIDKVKECKYKEVEESETCKGCMNKCIMYEPNMNGCKDKMVEPQESEG